MNCRQCEHFKPEGGPTCDVYIPDKVQLRWPCARGVASLKDYSYQKVYDPRGFGELVQRRPVQKLPWLIEEHDCPEFEEAG